MTKKSAAPKKILFTALLAEGHINPLTGLAKQLKENGYDVRFYISEDFEQKMKSIDNNYFLVRKSIDINSTNILQHFPELKTTNDPVEKNKIYQKLLIKVTQGYFEDLQQIYLSFPFDMMVVSGSYPVIPLIRHRFKVPVVSIGTIPLAEASPDLGPYPLGLPPAKDDETRAQYAGLHHHNSVIYKEATDQYAAILTAAGVRYERPEIDDLYDFLIRRANLYLQIGVPGFEYKRSNLGPNIRYVGALLPYSKVNHHKKWYDERLKKYNKVVFVTQGTIESDVTKLLEPTLKAFIHTDTLVIAATGGNGTQLLREKYPADNLIVDDFIPYAEVMPYASAYVTNGGYGGTLLSILNKVPLVAAGLHEGKSEICARIGYFKIGIDLKTETPSPEAIYDAVNKVTGNKLYKDKVVKLAEEFSRYDAISLSVKYITELLDENDQGELPPLSQSKS